LDNRSSLEIAMQVQEGVEQVDLTLVNPLLLYNDNGKYQLAFIGKDATMSIDVKVDRCAANACLLDQLKEYNAIFSKGEATLLEMKKTQNTCINKVKSLLVSEYTLINLKRFENTKCQYKYDIGSVNRIEVANNDDGTRTVVAFVSEVNPELDLKSIQQRIQRLIEVHSSGLMPVNVMIVKS